MPQVLYEYAGPAFDREQSARFAASVGRDYYAADCLVRPERSDFYLRNTRNWAGQLPISEHRCVGARTVVKRSSRQVRDNNADVYLVWIPVRGAVTISQGGRSTVIGRGTLALSSSHEPLRIVTELDARQEHLSYQILLPAGLVHDALPDPGRLCATSHSSDLGGTRIARELFMSLYEEGDHIDGASSMALAQSALNALFHALSPDQRDTAPPAGAREVKLQRLLDYIALNHSDPDLSTEKAAGACGISTRYLHYLLKERGLRFHDHLWDARLDSAHRQLADPALSRRTIAEIAYSAGFKSTAHFSRAFRRRFHRSPREVRCQGGREDAVSLSSGTGLHRH